MKYFLADPPQRERRNLTGLLLVALIVGLAVLALAANAVVLNLTVSADPAPRAERTAIPGDKVAVYNLAGAMRVEGGTGRDVTVDVTRGGRDGDQLQLATGEVAGVANLRVLYPRDRIVYPGMGRGSRTTMTVGDDGRFSDSSIRRGFDPRRVTISGSGSGLEAHADLVVRVPAGRTLSVYLGVGRVDVTNVDGTLDVDVASAEVRATHTRGGLTIDTGSGEVNVTDAEGTLSIDTGSGEVRVDGAHGDLVNVDTGSGAVTVADVAAGELRIDTGSGEVGLTGVKADVIDVDTGSGEVDIALSSGFRSLRVDTGSGSVTVSAPATLSATVRVENSGGGISTDFPMASMRRSEDGLEGRIGEGRGRIDIETGSGSVRITRAR